MEDAHKDVLAKDILAERLAGLAVSFGEFRLDVKEQFKIASEDIKQCTKDGIANAARDREKWTELLRDMQKDMIQAVHEIQDRRDKELLLREAAHLHRIQDLEVELHELQEEVGELRVRVWLIIGATLAVCGVLALFNNFFGFLKDAPEIMKAVPRLPKIP